MWFPYYKIANCITSCDAMHCYLRCGYAILWAVVMQILQFVQFGEHPYLQAMLGIQKITQFLSQFVT